MINKNNQQVLIGGAIVFRDRHKGKRQFLIVRQKEGGGWEIPKATVRRGESSVRAVIRFTGEQAGITARVLEEAGRSAATVMLNGKSVLQKSYYYLIMQRAAGGEVIGFGDHQWLEYGQAFKKLGLKKEQEIFKNTREILKQWEKNHKNYKEEEEELLLQQELQQQQQQQQ